MAKPTRFIGLDIHKRYFVAMGVDAEQNQVLGPHKVTWDRFEKWIQTNLTKDDALVIEMTTNTWEVYDTLVPHVHSVTVVHPPHVALIVKAPVKTDQKAALTLAQLHAARLLTGIWVPPQPIRDLRALVAQRRQMAGLGTKAKNQLHSVLHRHQIIPPEPVELFHPDFRGWWEALPVTPLEMVRIQSNLDTLEFAQRQKKRLEEQLGIEAAKDDRIPLLIQLPGIGLLNATAIIAAIGDVTRFPEAKNLVGYAGLGAKVHDSGEMHVTGKITKMGRRGLRSAMVDAANHAVDSHPHWKKQFQYLESRIGRSKAMVAIARKLLIVVWHVLMKQVADRFANPEQVAVSFFNHIYRVKVRNLPGHLKARAYTRQQLDRLGIGADMQKFRYGSKMVTLPPSTLKK